MKGQALKFFILSAYLIFCAAPNISHAESAGESHTELSPEGVSGPEQKKYDESLATKSKTTRKVIRSTSKTALEKLGTSLIFSADIGVLSAIPSKKSDGLQSKYGLSVEGKALGSVLLNNYLIDAGLGWFFYNVSGDEPVFADGQPLLDADGNVVTDPVGIKLTGTLLEVSPSYRMSNSMFVGPTLQLRYPADLGYNSRIERRSLGINVGAQVGYQMFDRDLNTRFVGRVMMPVNDKDWLGFFVMAGLQIGLPFSQPEHLTIQESTIKTSEKKVVEYKKQIFKFKVVRDVIKLVLDNLIVLYPEPGRPTVTTESQSFLVDLSQSLSESENQWGSLQIDTVSTEHAKSIRDALVSAGITENKVKLGTVLAGDRQSPTPPVEFTFRGVKNQLQLMSAVRKAMRAMSIPETCDQDGKCE